jgi:hypothetical protein
MSVAALNWAVSQTLPSRDEFYVDQEDAPPHRKANWYVVYKRLLGEFRFQPALRWEEGGPLIEKYELDIRYDADVTEFGPPSPYWEAYHAVSGQTGMGATPLQAAMTCIAKAHFGETMLIPGELS